MNKQPKKATAPISLVIESDWGLSFVTTTRTKRGRTVSRCYFDVPDEGEGEGYKTGLRAAAELLQAKQEGKFVPAAKCIKEACRILDAPRATPPYAESRKDKRGAAWAFMNTIEAMLNFAAVNCDHQAWLQVQLEGAAKHEARLAEVRAARTNEFVERMRTARRSRLGSKGLEVRHATA